MLDITQLLVRGLAASDCVPLIFRELSERNSCEVCGYRDEGFETNTGHRRSRPSWTHNDGVQVKMGDRANVRNVPLHSLLPAVCAPNPEPT